MTKDRSETAGPETEGPETAGSADAPQRRQSEPDPASGQALGGLPANDVVAEAAVEQRRRPTTPVEAADLADRYYQMTRLAALFDDAGGRMRELGEARQRRARRSRGDRVRARCHPAPTPRSRRRSARRRSASPVCSKDRWSSTPTPWCSARRCSPTSGSTSCRRRRTTRSGSIAGRAIGYLAPEVDAGRHHRCGRPDRDRLPGPGRCRGVPQRARRGEPRADGARNDRRRADRQPADARAADCRRQGRQGGLIGRDPAGCEPPAIAPLTTDFEAALRDAAIGTTTTSAFEADAGRNARSPGPAGLPGRPDGPPRGDDPSRCGCCEVGRGAGPSFLGPVPRRRRPRPSGCGWSPATRPGTPTRWSVPSPRPSPHRRSA